VLTEDTDQIEDLDIAISDVPMLAQSTITQVEDAAMVLCIDEPEAELQSWLVLSAVLRARAKMIRQRIEQIAIKWIEAHGPLVAGDLEYRTADCAGIAACLAVKQATCPAAMLCSARNNSLVSRLAMRNPLNNFEVYAVRDGVQTSTKNSRMVQRGLMKWCGLEKAIQSLTFSGSARR
jgi:hypothetical protein